MTMLGLPASVATVIFTVALALVFAPYFPGKKIGPLHIPNLGPRAKESLKFLGPVILGGAIMLFPPFIARNIVKPVEIENTIPPLVNSEFSNGQQCSENKQCSSGYCYPGPPDNSKSYCLHEKLNCAYPGQNGYQYGDSVLFNGNAFECYHPAFGKAKWRIAN